MKVHNQSIKDHHLIAEVLNNNYFTAISHEYSLPSQQALISPEVLQKQSLYDFNYITEANIL